MKEDPQFQKWFGGYVDVTLEPEAALASQPQSGKALAVMAFITSGRTEPCEPMWGGTYSLDQAGAKLGLDRQVEGFRDSGHDVAVSFGGQQGLELAAACSDTESLQKAYSSVITRYDLNVIDLDVEGIGASEVAVAERRAAVIMKIQADRPSGNPLQVWLTLPVSRNGLTPAAALSVRTMLEAGVSVAGINLMVMNFGPLPAGVSMLDASTAAAERTHNALQEVYSKAGRSEGPADLWNRIGLTPMIGVNDVEANVFTLEDARALNAYALSKGIGRLSMWSYNRDVACSSPEIGVSHSCSGIAQERGDYAKLLGASFADNPG